MSNLETTIKRLCMAALCCLCATGCSKKKSMDDEGYSPPPQMGEGGGYYYGYDTAGGAEMDGDYASEDTGWYPPEVEVTPSYLVPKGSGRYVFIPDEARDSVVIVDSETLAIRVAEVGSRPTHLAPLEYPDGAAVAVINLNSDEVTIVRISDDGALDTLDLPVRPDTNALAPSPDGRFVIAFHDPELAAVSGSPGTDQEISILSLAPGREGSFERAVGMHPWKVLYNESITAAFVVTEGGINIVDLEDLSSEDRSEPVALFEHGTYDAETADIEITPDGTLAIGRKADSAELKIASLDGGGLERTYVLPAVTTDLDISADGSFGVLVLRSMSSLAFFNLPLPEDPTADPFTYVGLENRIVGVATMTSDGNRILLSTTTAGEEMDRRRLTLLDRAGDGWNIDSAVLERPIQSVIPVEGTSSGASTAVVVHQPIAPGAGQKAFAYSLVTLPSLMSKLQQLSSAPGQLLFTPAGDYGYLLVDGELNVEKMNMETLIVDDIELSSIPISAGMAEETNRVFIAQDHPSGRMTFFGVYDDTVSTVTGFNLNEDIETSE